MSRILAGLFVGMSVVSAPTSAAAQSDETAETQILALLQTQARAFNAGDLDGTLATFAPQVDWLAIGGEYHADAEEVAAAMRTWIDFASESGNLLAYPEDGTRVTLLSDVHATADIDLRWERPRLGPVRPAIAGTETLFLVLVKTGSGWRIRHVRNTTPS